MDTDVTSIAGTSFIIPADHPSIPGHFPGRPLVPGAVLLDHAMVLTERAIGHRINRILSAKFPQPLAPGATCSVEMELREDSRVLLHCVSGPDTVLVAVLAYDQQSGLT
jgi:3-hydroxyacyl-[acyl-carrier-protein] dehydratase